MSTTWLTPSIQRISREILIKTRTAAPIFHLQTLMPQVAMRPSPVHGDVRCLIAVSSQVEPNMADQIGQSEKT